jgi:Concanavalin A-like lectin/glucanases superfamily
MLIAQSSNCDPTAIDTSGFEGTAYFNYGSVNKSKTAKYRTASAVGQSFTGVVENDAYNSNLGFYARFLLPPFKVKVNATQGDLLDRIQITWQIDVLGPSSNEGFNIYRDNIFLATVGPSIRNYNDFNVIAGVAYTYTVRGLNTYGEGSPSEALGFQVPNGVVTGWVQTRNGNAVPDALVTLMPMQGFALKFDPQDGATANSDVTNPFMPTVGNDWTTTFWIKTNSSDANGSVFHLSPSPLYIKTINSASGNEGIEVATSAIGGTILSAEFPDSTKNGWHHVALSYSSGTGRLYIDGVLKNQGTIAPVASVDTLKMGAKAGLGGWNGSLDEFRIYHTYLDELDFGEVMEGTASSQTPGLTHYWKMDEELGEKSYDIKKRNKLFFCGAHFDEDRPPVRTAGKTNAEGYYRIESASYGTGTTFLAQPMKSFYLHKSIKLAPSEMAHATLPDFPLTKKATIETWINTTGSVTAQTILHKKWNGNECQLFLNPNGLNNDLKLTLNGQTNTYGNITPNFHHLAFTLDSLTGNVSGYLDGVLLATHSYGEISGSWSDPLQPWVIGARKDGLNTSQYFSGLIDEVAVYDTTLSIAKINAHFTNSRDMQEKGLRVYFPMDEGSGVRVGNVGSVLLEPGTLVDVTWSSFASNQETQPHVFAPKTRQVTLNPSVTSVDQVDFIDQSTVAVSGFVRYANTDCFASRVEILVNGVSNKPAIFTDSLGEFIVDFDPGTTASLSPKLADHAFVPAFWDVTNVTSPIAGIIFNDITTRNITGQVAGGSVDSCRKSIIKAPAGMGQGTICKVKISTADGCFTRQQTLFTQDGLYEFNDLPPVENMIVAISSFSDPEKYTYFQDKIGGSTVDLTKQDTVVDFIYIAEPQIEVINGLEPFSPMCNVIVMDQGDTKVLEMRLKEQYVAIPSNNDNGTCYIDTASFKIINGFEDSIRTKQMSGGILLDTFIVGSPNPTPPYFKTLQLVSTTIDGNDSEFVTQGIVTGLREKDKTFTTILPETPTMVLRDPPGDGSYSFIEKNEKICQKMTFSMSNDEGGGLQTIIDLGPDVDFGIFVGPDVEVSSNVGPDITATHSVKKLTQNSMELCTSYDQRISTSEDDLIVGHEQGGDIFVGGALNIDIGFANLIGFDAMTCLPTNALSVTVSPGNYETEFMYSEWAIRNNVLIFLQNILDSVETMIPLDTEAINLYQTSIDRWNTILDNDSIQIKNGIFKRNISFDAGVSYEYAETSTVDSTSTSTYEETTIKDANINLLAFGFGIGGGNVIKVKSETVTGKSDDYTREEGIKTGYVLKDDDPLDAYSIDVAMDTIYKTPVFRIKAGQTSCPWEKGTAKREGVLLTSVDGPVRTDVPPNEPAVFHFIMGNTSATNETWTYAFTAGPESNPHSAKIFCNGAPMNQIQWYAIPWGTSIPVTVYVERGPAEYDYEDLEIVLYSACEDQRANDLGILPDTAKNLYSAVYISAHFIRPCSEVKINVPQQNWVVFPDTFPNTDDDVVQITVSGYDTLATDFKEIRVQYHRVDGDGAWNEIQDTSVRYNPNWSGLAGLSIPNPPLLEGRFTQFYWDTQGLEDDEYEIRAVTNCTGDAAGKSGYSEHIKGKIDRQPPSLVGVPQPSDGVYHVGDEISFTFNQDINCNRVLEVANVELINTETNLPLDIVVSCVGNKIVIESNFPNETFENKILRAELHNIQDLTGNIMAEADWEFYVDRNELAWLTDSITLTKYSDQTKSISAKIHNRGGYPVPFVITAPDYIRVSPNRGTLVANEVGTITFTVDSLVQLGEFWDSIIMHTETGINPFFMGGDEVLNMQTRVLCRPDKWVINPDGFNGAGYKFSMNFTLELNIEGTPSTDVEDIVGAYVDGQLRGVSKVNFYPVLNKYLAFLTVYSDTATSETVEFQIWDASECKLYASTVETFDFEADDIIGSPTVQQVIHTNDQLLRKIYIHPGWNWISFNLDLLTPDINGALSSLTNPSGCFIKNQDNISGYSDNLQLWLGPEEIDSLSSFPMYQYRGLQPDSISMVGGFIDPETPMPMHSGWNWIGYLPHQGLSIADALGALSPQAGDFIKSQISFSQYVDNLGWVGNLGYLNAPNGYLLKLAGADTLVYPDPQNLVGNKPSAEGVKPIAENLGKTLVKSTAPEAMPFGHWQVDPTKFEHNMNAIAIVVRQENNENLLSENDEVAAFVGNEVRGSSKALFIPALNAYMLFMTIYANAEGETLTFKYYDASEGKEVSLIDKTSFKINHIWGKVDLPQPLHVSQVVGTDDLGTAHPISLYPNPFMNQLAIQVNATIAEDVSIEFTDVHGVIVDEKIVKIQLGSNEIMWKPQPSLVGGAYFIKVKGSSINHTQRVLYIR